MRVRACRHSRHIRTLERRENLNLVLKSQTTDNKEREEDLKRTTNVGFGGMWLFRVGSKKNHKFTTTLNMRRMCVRDILT
jgi:hypothetical protein